MRVVFAEPAARDLDDIVEYIALDNPTAAERVFRTIVDTTHRLVDFPEMGRAGRLPGTREIIVAGFPYLVVYQVTDDAIAVVAVFHEARDLARALVGRNKTTDA